MKNFVISTFAIIAFFGCTTNQRESTSEMSEDNFQEYNNKKNNDGLIAIETSFEPTLDLTDEIRNSTLEELIKQGKGKLSRYDQMRADEEKRMIQQEIDEEKKELRRKGYSEKEINEMVHRPRLPKFRPKPTYEYTGEYKLKYVPKTSNLAKVYYLEDMGRFIEHNQEFYNEVISKIKKDNKQNQEQKNWDNYL